MRKLLLILAFGCPLWASSYNCINTSADVPAIQSLVNAGGTLTLAGLCMFATSSVNIGNAITITGTATMNGSSGGTVFTIIGNYPISISGLTFNGTTAVHVTDFTLQNFTFTHNTIQNTNSGNGITVDGILQLSSIQYNTFYYVAPAGFASATFASLGFPGCDSSSCDVAGSIGISIYGGVDQTSISYNSFDLMANDCMHVGWNEVGAPSRFFVTKNNLFSYNKMSRIHRIGLEIQALWSYPYCRGVGGATETCAGIGGSTNPSEIWSTGTVIAGNYLSTWFLPYYTSIAYSILTYGDANYVNNTAVHDLNPSMQQFGGQLGFEDFGFNVLTQGNVVSYNSATSANGFQTAIVYGYNNIGTFTTQNNVFCGPGQVTTNNFCTEQYSCSPPSNYGPVTAVNQYNYIANSCTNSGGNGNVSMITPAFVNSSASGSTTTYNFSVQSVLSIANVQFFIDSSATPVSTQIIADQSSSFAMDQKWRYHATISPAAYSSSSHTLSAVFSDVSGAMSTASTSFTGGGASAPTATFTPALLSFGNVLQSNASVAMVSALSNTGSAPLSSIVPTVTGPNAADFALTNGCGSTLTVSANCPLSVVFTPSMVGNESATLSVADNASGSPQTIALTGTGTNAQCVNNLILNCAFVSGTSPWLFNGAGTSNWNIQNNGPSSVPAANVSIQTAASGNELYQTGLSLGTNGTSLTLNLQIKASRAQAIQIYGIDNTTFTAYGLNYTPSITTSFATYSTTFSVINSPPSGATRFTIQFPNALPGDTFVIPLATISTATGTPIASLPSSLGFGSETVGSTTAANTAVLANSGSATMTISSITVGGVNSGDFAIGATTCGSTLAAGASCNIPVTFTPSAAGARNATITVVDNAPGSPQSISLSGTGAGAGPIPIAPGSYTFTDGSTGCGGSPCAPDSGFLINSNTNKLEVYVAQPLGYANQSWGITSVAGITNGFRITSLGSPVGSTITNPSGTVTNATLVDIGSGSPVFQATASGNNDVWFILCNTTCTVQNYATRNYMQTTGLANFNAVTLGATSSAWVFTRESPVLPLVIQSLNPIATVGNSITITANQAVTWSLAGAGAISTMGPSASTTYAAPSSVIPQQTMLGWPVLPNDSVFSSRIDNLPLNSNSAAWVAFITAPISFLPSWGVTYSDSTTPIYSLIPYYGDGAGNQPDYANVPYPGPLLAKTENGSFVSPSIVGNSGSDHHVLEVNQSNGQFNEWYNQHISLTGAPFSVQYPCQVTGTNCNVQSVIPPYTTMSFGAPTTSTDAAGLPLAPLTWTLSDIKAGPKHAVRFTQGSANACLWPSFFYSPNGNSCGMTTPNSTNIPFGARFKLKTQANGGPNITTVCTASSVLNADCVRMLTALTQYGMILADIGGGGQIEISTDAVEDPSIRAAEGLIQAASITGSSFQAVDESSLQQTTANGYVLPNATGSYAVDPANSYQPPSTYALITATPASGAAQKVSVAIEGFGIGMPSNTLVIAAGIGAYALPSWVTPSTASQTVTWSLTGCGALSGSNYTPPASGSAPCVAVLTATATADPNVTAALYVSVIASSGTGSTSGYRIDLGCLAQTETCTTTDGHGYTWYSDFGVEASTPVFLGEDYPTWQSPAGTNIPEYLQYGTPMYTYGGDIRYCAAVPNGNYKIRWLGGKNWDVTAPQGSVGFTVGSYYNPFYVDVNGVIVSHFHDWIYPIGYQYATTSDTYVPATVSNNMLCSGIHVLAPDVAVTAAQGFAPLYFQNGTQTQPNFTGACSSNCTKSVLTQGLEIIPDTIAAHISIETQQVNSLVAGQSITLYPIDWHTGVNLASTVWSIVQDPYPPTTPSSIVTNADGSVTLKAGSTTILNGEPLIVNAVNGTYSATAILYSAGGTRWPI